MLASAAKVVAGTNGIHGMIIRTSDEWAAKVKDKWGSVLNLKGGRRIW